MPRQVSHGAAVITVPNTLRRTACTCPAPPHTWQATGAVPGSAPLPMHRVALDHALDLEVLADAEDRFGERQRDAHPEVLAVAAAGAGSPPPRRGGEAPLTEEQVEDVLDVAERRALRSAGGAERVVATTLLRIREDLVRARDLLEPVLGAVGAVHVGVMLTGERPVGLLDVLVAGAAIDAEDLVEIASRHGSASISVAISERRLATARTEAIADR